MVSKYDEALLKLSKALTIVTELQLENRAGLVAVQIAFLSLSSQLADQGLVQPELIAKDLKRAVDGMRDSLGKSAGIIEEFAAKIEALAAHDNPPPTAGKLRLVSPDE